MNKDKINILRFADLQGFTEVDRITVKKMYSGLNKTYQEWYKLLKPDFKLKEMPIFEENKEAIKETIKEAIKEKIKG